MKTPPIDRGDYIAKKVMEAPQFPHVLPSYLVEAERFIALMNRESFDYTEWRRDMFEGMSVREISRLAMQEIEETQ